MYRAAPDAGSMVAWEQNEAQPIDGVEQVKAALSALFPELRWTAIDVGDATHWSALGKNRPDAPYVDLSISADGLDEKAPSDSVYFVVGRKSPPSVMRKIMEALGLNHVTCIDSGELVDPYAYGDDDPYYAIKK